MIFAEIYYIQYTIILLMKSFSYFSFQNEARNATQILAVIAVSFGAYIYGTTVVFPAVANPSLRKSNKTYWSSNATIYSSSIHSNVSSTSSLSDESLSYNSTVMPSSLAASSQPNSTDAYLPFLITDWDLSLVGKSINMKKYKKI